MSRSTISMYQLFQLILDEPSARAYLEGRLWHDGIACPECKGQDRITVRKGGYYRCNPPQYETPQTTRQTERTTDLQESSQFLFLEPSGSNTPGAQTRKRSQANEIAERKGAGRCVLLMHRSGLKSRAETRSREEPSDLGLLRTLRHGKSGGQMNTDTQVWNQALEEYRKRSGDMRKPCDLPSRILSELLQRAQQLKEEALTSWMLMF